MRCASVESHLPGYVGGDLRAGTATLVEEHLGTCEACRTKLMPLEQAYAGLAVLATRDVEAPPGLADAVLERVHGPSRRVLPIPPVIPTDAMRILVENREALVSAAGAAMVVGGAAWALWRASRRRLHARTVTTS